jgi:hypothetical protein
MPSKQETFDTVVAHLRQQGVPAMRRRKSGDECLYRLRLPDGTVLKCAAGCLIPDGLYTPAMEGHTATWSKVRRALVQCGHDAEFVEELQSAHDDNWDRLEQALCELAAAYDLVYAPPVPVG